jgi:hypothetical protein
MKSKLKEIISVMEKIPGNDIQIHTNYEKANQTILWKTMLTLLGRVSKENRPKIPDDIVAVCHWLSKYSGLSIQHFESIAQDCRYANTGEESKQIALRALKSFKGKS